MDQGHRVDDSTWLKNVILDIIQNAIPRTMRNDTEVS